MNNQFDDDDDEEDYHPDSEDLEDDSEAESAESAQDDGTDTEMGTDPATVKRIRHDEPEEQEEIPEPKKPRVED